MVCGNGLSCRFLTGHYGKRLKCYQCILFFRFSIKDLVNPILLMWYGKNRTGIFLSRDFSDASGKWGEACGSFRYSPLLAREENPPDPPSRCHLRRCRRSFLLAAYCSYASVVSPRRLASNTLMVARYHQNPWYYYGPLCAGPILNDP